MHCKDLAYIWDPTSILLTYGHLGLFTASENTRLSSNVALLQLTYLRNMTMCYHYQPAHYCIREINLSRYWACIRDLSYIRGFRVYISLSTKTNNHTHMSVAKRMGCYCHANGMLSTTCQHILAAVQCSMNVPSQ